MAAPSGSVVRPVSSEGCSGFIQEPALCCRKAMGCEPFSGYRPKALGVPGTHRRPRVLSVQDTGLPVTLFPTPERRSFRKAWCLPQLHHLPRPQVFKQAGLQTTTDRGPTTPSDVHTSLQPACVPGCPAGDRRGETGRNLSSGCSQPQAPADRL